jgi:hypothetical protein
MRKLYRRMVGGVRRKRGGMNYHGVFAAGKNVSKRKRFYHGCAATG